MLGVVADIFTPVPAPFTFFMLRGRNANHEFCLVGRGRGMNADSGHNQDKRQLLCDALQQREVGAMRGEINFTL